jgi:hypothetical protein
MTSMKNDRDMTGMKMSVGINQLYPPKGISQNAKAIHFFLKIIVSIK